MVVLIQCYLGISNRDNQNYIEMISLNQVFSMARIHRYEILPMFRFTIKWISVIVSIRTAFANPLAIITLPGVVLTIKFSSVGS